MVAFSVIRQRGFPGRLKQGPDARRSVKYSRNRVTDVEEGPKVR